MRIRRKGKPQLSEQQQAYIELLHAVEVVQRNAQRILGIHQEQCLEPACPAKAILTETLEATARFVIMLGKIPPKGFTVNVEQIGLDDLL